MKVTKAKALKATPLMRSTRFGAPVQRATWRECSPSILPRTRRRGPRKASPALIRWTPGQSEARPRRVNCRFDWLRWFQVARWAGPARREERAEWFCIQALCFGDFHLSQQMKVTRPPGRNPAMRARKKEVTRPPGRDPAMQARKKKRNRTSDRSGSRQCDHARRITSPKRWPLRRKPAQTIRVDSPSNRKPKAAPCSQLKRVMNWV
jgi:hypothetical protein